MLAFPVSATARPAQNQTAAVIPIYVESRTPWPCLLFLQGKVAQYLGASRLWRSLADKK
jgi:hypothetical protein